MVNYFSNKGGWGYAGTFYPWIAGKRGAAPERRGKET